MKTICYFAISFLFLTVANVFGQNATPQQQKNNIVARRLTLEPGIGINPYPSSDVLLSNVLQWNIKKHLSLVSYTSYAFNNAFQRDFNYIRNDYNYSLNQKFGVGTSLYTKRSAHTFSLLAGIKYDAFKETMHNPAFETVSVSATVVSPDFGLLYNVKVGVKKCFFSYRMYLPLYPYPFRNSDILSIDGNFANITMEFGVGIRLK